jgi:hypothetical protein
MDVHPASAGATLAVRVAMRMAPPVAVYEALGRYLPPRRYEDEGSERTSTGTIAVTSDSSWRATLSVPLPDADAVFLRIERMGRLPDGYRGAEESAALSVPAAEVDALMAVLAGVIAQARKDGVLV